MAVLHKMCPDCDKIPQSFSRGRDYGKGPTFSEKTETFTKDMLHETNFKILNHPRCRSSDMQTDPRLSSRFYPVSQWEAIERFILMPQSNGRSESSSDETDNMSLLHIPSELTLFGIQHSVMVRLIGFVQ
jgi:hypothetical protein